MAKLQEGQSPNFFDATNMTSVPRKKLDAGDPILDYRIYHFQSCPILSNPVQSCSNVRYQMWWTSALLWPSLDLKVEDNYVHIQ